jgi:hypothetical protein
VEEGGNALLADPGDADSLAGALRRLIGDAEMRLRFGARSRALYEERFDARSVSAAMEGFLRRVSGAHPRAEAAPADLRDRLAAVVREVLPLDTEAATRTAADLLAPSPESWRGVALGAEHERAAWHVRAVEAERQVGEWRARALEAERQREVAEAALAKPSLRRRLHRALRG